MILNKDSCGCVLGQVGLHEIMWVFALMPWLVKPCSIIQLTREEEIANYSSRRAVENAFGKLIQGPAGHNEAKAKGC